MALHRGSTAIYDYVGAEGGITPRPRRRSRLALTMTEREEISRQLARGGSLRAIGRALGRAPSTISREVARNHGRTDYRAATADRQAWRRTRRPQPCRLATRPALRRVVGLVSGTGLPFLDDASWRRRLLRRVVVLLYRIALARTDKVWFQNSDDLEMFCSMGLTTPAQAVLIRSGGVDLAEFSTGSIQPRTVQDVRAELDLREGAVNVVTTSSPAFSIVVPIGASTPPRSMTAANAPACRVWPGAPSFESKAATMNAESPRRKNAT